MACQGDGLMESERSEDISQALLPLPALVGCCMQKKTGRSQRLWYSQEKRKLGDWNHRVDHGKQTN